MNWLGALYRSCWLLGCGGIVWLCACSSLSQRQAAHLSIFEEVPANLPPSHAQPVQIPALGLALTVSRYPALTDRCIRRVEVITHESQPALRVSWDYHGQMQLEELTTRMRGRRLVIFLRERPVAAPLVQERISDGVLIITGDFTRAEAETAAQWLNRQARERQATIAPY